MYGDIMILTPFRLLIFVKRKDNTPPFSFCIQTNPILAQLNSAQLCSTLLNFAKLCLTWLNLTQLGSTWLNSDQLGSILFGSFYKDASFLLHLVIVSVICLVLCPFIHTVHDSQKWLLFETKIPKNILHYPKLMDSLGIFVPQQIVFLWILSYLMLPNLNIQLH